MRLATAFRLLCFASIASLLAAASQADSQPEMRPGKWKVTMNMDMGGQKSNFDMTNCMGKEDVESQAGIHSPAAGGNTGEGEWNSSSDGCTINVKVKGNTMTMRSACGAEITETISTYSAESFLMKTKVTGGENPGTTIMEGKRIGDC